MFVFFFFDRQKKNCIRKLKDCSHEEGESIKDYNEMIQKEKKEREWSNFDQLATRTKKNPIQQNNPLKSFHKTAYCAPTKLPKRNREDKGAKAS